MTAHRLHHPATTLPSPIAQEGSALQDHYTVDPRLLPSRNPFEYHAEALSLQPMKQYVITTLLELYYIVSVVLAFFFWCPCMAINVSVQYNSGLVPDIILFTSCSYDRGTRSNAMKRFCLCSLYSHLNVLTFFLTGECPEGLGALKMFPLNTFCMRSVACANCFLSLFRKNFVWQLPFASVPTVIHRRIHTQHISG